MTIQTRDQLINAMANNSTRILVDKANIGNTAQGQFHSLWRAGGQPTVGALPVAASVCSNTTGGAIPFAQQIAPVTSYLTIFEALCSNANTTIEVHDRLAHMGGLNGTLTTAQTVGLDLLPLLATSNLDARKGAADYSDVQWWLEWYVDTGGTGANVTVNVTYNDGSSGNLSTFALAATRRASFMQLLNSLIPPADGGKYIRGVNSVTLSASTGTAGNFGVTCTRYRAALYKPTSWTRFTADWADLGLPEVYNGSCLFLVQLASTGTTGSVRATGKISHG